MKINPQAYKFRNIKKRTIFKSGVYANNDIYQVYTKQYYNNNNIIIIFFSTTQPGELFKHYSRGNALSVQLPDPLFSEVCIGIVLCQQFYEIATKSIV